MTPARGVSTFLGDGLRQNAGGNPSMTPARGARKTHTRKTPARGARKTHTRKTPARGVSTYRVRPSPGNVETPLAGVFDGRLVCGRLVVWAACVWASCVWASCPCGGTHYGLHWPPKPHSPTGPHNPQRQHGPPRLMLSYTSLLIPRIFLFP